MPITKVLNPDFNKIIADHNMSVQTQSIWVDLLNFNTAFVQVAWSGATGAFDGKLQIEASNDLLAIDPPAFAESVKTITTPNGGVGYNLWQLGARYYRLTYIPNGITGGTLTASITAKDA